MPIYSGGGSFGIYDYSAIVQTGYIIGNASEGGTSDILDIYCSGHWGQGIWIEIDLITTYYGQGVIRYIVKMPRGNYATVTEVQSIGNELPSGASSLTVTGNTVIGENTHSGAGVLRSTIRMSNESYMQTYAVIKIGKSQQASAYLYDNATSTTSVASWAQINGSSIHFRTVSLAGHPSRRT